MHSIMSKAFAVLALMVLLLLPASSSRASAETDDALSEALSHLGFNEFDSQQIIDRSWTVSESTLFRFASSLDPPTITEDEAPWAVPVRIGVAVVTWPDETTIPSFPATAEVVNGALYLPRGGPLADTEYALMWAQMGGPIDIGDQMELFQNWSFPFAIPGQPVWMPADVFPYDTWGGASVIPYITYGPQPWSFNLSVVQPDGSLLDTEFNGFGLISGDTILVGVDTASLLTNGFDGVTYGFAGHIHDGTLGSTESSRSLVSFATGLPGSLYPIQSTETIVVGSQPPPPTTTTPSSTTTTASTTTTTLAAVDEPTETPEAGGEPVEGTGFPWLMTLLILGGLLLLGIGARLLFVPPKDPCAELLKAWNEAKRLCDEARQAAEKAKKACDEAKTSREDLERKHRNICKEWPPACEDEGSYIEESGEPGSRITSRDLHARRIALGRLWDEYQENNASAQDIENAWDRANTPEFREEMRKQTAAKRAERDQLEKDIEKAQQKEKEACDRHAKAEKAADDACARADEARRAYEECVKNQNAKAFVEAVMNLGSDDGEQGETETPAPASAATGVAQPAQPVTTTPDDPLAGRKVGVSVPFLLDKTGLDGLELERAEKLETIFSIRRGTCQIDKVALDLWRFNSWHEENFGEPWFTWSAEGGNPNSVTATSGRTDTFMQSRVMACYEFVHFCAYICSDQLGRQRIGGDDEEAVLLDEYSVDWGFPDEINTNTSPIQGSDAPEGSVVTGVFRWGDYNNSAGYYHVGISIGDAKLISLGSDGLLLEDITGTVGGCFPSVGYSEVSVGDYRYSNTNPAPQSKQ